MRRLLLVILCLLPSLGQAQSRTVSPEELDLSVTVEAMDHVPFVGEMVLLTIRGIYRRHITLEALHEPDLEGFNWTQLGADLWRDERIDGEKVKTMTRRMAVYPNRAGDLTIGAFTHKLTLTDEGDGWFEHDVRSEPVTLSVAAAPGGEAWWFPVKQLRISDQWSNAPDQLKRGEGVLRVIRLEALGATPEMMPPMPELTSPSGRIFPHPDKRLVELSPQGPITYTFWRWTIQPGNDTSAVVEPLTLSYFDTQTRVPRQITISAQRIAYGDVIPAEVQTPSAQEAGTMRLPGLFLAALGFGVFVCGVALALAGRKIVGRSALRRFPLFDPLTRRVRQAARSGDAVALRRAASHLILRDGSSGARRRLMAELDGYLFSRGDATFDLKRFAQAFLKANPTVPLVHRTGGDALTVGPFAQLDRPSSYKQL